MNKNPYENERYHDADAGTDDEPMRGFVNLLIWIALLAGIVFLIRSFVS